MESAHAVLLCYADRRELAADTIAALVTDDDRRRLAPTMHPRRRAEYLAARALLRHALGEYTGTAGAALSIDVTAAGKPECVGGPAISVSHSGDFVVCALTSSGSVGVDIETADSRRELQAIAERYFTPAEASWLAADPAARFRRLWVLKEAYLKALGVGLAGGLHTLECVIEPPRVVARVASEPAPQLALLEGEGCHVGIATVGAAQRLDVEVRRFAGEASRDALGPPRLVARTE